MSGINLHGEKFLTGELRLGEDALQERHDHLALKGSVVALAVQVAHPAGGEEAIELSQFAAHGFALLLEERGGYGSSGSRVEYPRVRHQDEGIAVLPLQCAGKLFEHAKLIFF